MATWKPKKTHPAEGPTMPRGAPGVPTFKTPDTTVTRNGRAGKNGGLVVGAGVTKGMRRAPAKAPKKPAGPGSAGGGAWYDPSNTAARDAALISALSDPLKPITGTDAVSFARALAQSQTAPLLQDYDRQAGLAQSRADAQSARTASGSDALQRLIAAQMAGQQASAGAARDRIAGAGAQLQSSIDQGYAQAGQAAAADAATRGAGLDGGSAAQRAQELANAKARGQAGTSVALDQQAASAQSGDQLLQQIAAASAQQGGERQGAITSSLNTALRDVNEGRAKALSSGEQAFLSAIKDLKSQNTQTALATETLGLDQAKLASSDANAAADRAQKAREKALDRLDRAREKAQQTKQFYDGLDATASNRDKDRASREMIAANREVAAAKRAAAATKKGAPKLTPEDKKRREFIDNVGAYQQSGQLGSLKAEAVSRGAAKAPSTFRAMLANRGVGNQFTRQLLTDLAFGGLRPNTITAYRTLYGRNPPNEWARFKAKKKPSAGNAAAGVGATAKGSL